MLLVYKTVRMAVLVSLHIL